jgi:hypothetical protein
LNFDGEIGAASARLFAGLVIFPSRESDGAAFRLSFCTKRASSQGQLAVSKFPNTTCCAEKSQRNKKPRELLVYSLGIYEAT